MRKNSGGWKKSVSVALEARLSKSHGRPFVLHETGVFRQRVSDPFQSLYFAEPIYQYLRPKSKEAAHSPAVGFWIQHARIRVAPFIVGFNISSKAVALEAFVPNVRKNALQLTKDIRKWINAGRNRFVRFDVAPDSTVDWEMHYHSDEDPELKRLEKNLMRYGHALRKGTGKRDKFGSHVGTSFMIGREIRLSNSKVKVNPSLLIKAAAKTFAELAPIYNLLAPTKGRPRRIGTSQARFLEKVRPKRCSWNGRRLWPITKDIDACHLKRDKLGGTDRATNTFWLHKHPHDFIDKFLNIREIKKDRESRQLYIKIKAEHLKKSAATVKNDVRRRSYQALLKEMHLNTRNGKWFLPIERDAIRHLFS